jgi:hypothetical protein
MRPFLYAELVVNDLCEGRQAVRRAGGVRYDIHIRPVRQVVDAHDEGRRICGRADMMTFFAPAAICFFAVSLFVNRPVDSMT